MSLFEPNPEWQPAPFEASIMVTYKTAKHLPRRRRRKVERMRRKRATEEASKRFFGYLKSTEVYPNPLIGFDVGFEIQ